MLVTGLGGLAVAAALHRRGHRLAGLACCGITGLLVSPMSWTHHWVWVVPLLAAMVAAAWRRRSWAWALATAGLFAAFANPIPLPWPGRDPSLLRTPQGNQDVLLGLAILTAAALYLARERHTATGHKRSAAIAAASSVGV